MLTPGVRTIASFCSADKPQCVQVEDTGTEILVRDTKLGEDSPVLRFTYDEWNAFESGVKNDEFSVVRQPVAV